MPNLPFCTCTDLACPLNPANHARGCDFCVANCLKKNEVPVCFFKKAVADLSGHSDWSFAGFAAAVQEQHNK